MASCQTTLEFVINVEHASRQILVDVMLLMLASIVNCQNVMEYQLMLLRFAVEEVTVLHQTLVTVLLDIPAIFVPTLICH